MEVSIIKTFFNKKAEGTITVFLSLILLLILSLLFTIIEGARVNTAKVFAERALTTAMDSVLAEYYGPLWEEYHIFGYYAGSGSLAERREQISAVITDNMSYTFAPEETMSGAFAKEGFEIYGISTDNITISNEAALTDYEGELLINEAVEYMKYREPGDGIETLLNKLSLMETPEKVSYIMKEKQKAEEKLVEIDQGILKLMELYDGLMTSQKGIELAKDGSLKVTSSFIKKLCHKEVTMENVGINQESIFQAQKSNYVNPDIYFSDIEANFNQIDLLLIQITKLNNDQEAARLKLEIEQAGLAELKTIEEKSAEDRKEIKTLKESIKGIKSTINDLETQISDQKEKLLPYVATIKDSANSIIELAKEIELLINEAIASLDKILQKIAIAKPLIEQYEKLLNTEKKFIDEGVYSGLEEKLTELKKYIDIDENGYDFAGMGKILESNKTILINSVANLEKANDFISGGLYEDAKSYYTYAESMLFTYQISGLTLDYSTLVIDKSIQKTPFDDIGNLLQSGLTSLIIDPDNISKAELNTSEALPSEIAALTEEDTDYLAELSTLLESIVIGRENGGLGSLFSGFGDNTQIIPLLEDGVNNIAEHLLYQEYLKEHFGRYQAEKEQTNKPSVLSYEQEYLLAGKSKDQENLASVLSRIILLRTICNFVSILGIKEIQTEAKLIATSLVGFTGLPILISITQTLILVVWAFAEALLDTCALMMGREVPIIKKNVVMQFPDLFLISREYLRQKVSQMSDSKELSFSYQDYLRTFLLLKDRKDLAYLSMDLMQEDIRLRYQEDNYQIEDCLFGFDAAANFIIESKFTAASFVRKYLSNSTGGFHFNAKATYSY